jgi:hypothetical protein
MSKDKTVADYWSVNFTTQVGSGPDASNVVVQASVDKTLDADGVDAEFDFIAGRLSRQRIIGEIPAYVENIERMRGQIDQMEGDMKRLDVVAQEKWEKSGRAGKVEYNKSDNKNRTECLLNIKTLKERIKENENKLNYAIEVRDGKKAKAVKSA